MRVERRSGSDERAILTGMVVDPLVCSRIVSKWPQHGDGLFKSPWANIVGKWCVQYHQRYGEPPRNSLPGLARRWAAKVDREPETVQLVERFLGGLSDAYASAAKDTNPQFILDTAGAYFNKVRLERLAEAITDALDNGEVDVADAALASARKLELGAGSGIDLLNDSAAIRFAFEQQAEPLITYTGAMGKFWGQSLERDGFIALMGPEKRGKTWWLMELAWRAMLQRRKVAFFEVGDLSEAQIIRRYMVRAAAAPLYPKTILWPTSIDWPEEDGPESLPVIEHEEMRFTKPLTWRTAVKAAQRVLKTELKSSSDFLKLSIHPNSSIHVNGINTILDTWADNGFAADVVVIDYADILAPMPGCGSLDERGQTNATWKALRALSQSRHCLVITATQASASSYDAHTVTRKHFSLDKRKLAEVTGMVGLSQTEPEKNIGASRLSWNARREEEYSEKRCLRAAGCLAVARPVVRAIY